MEYYYFIIFIIFGLLPSLVWLFYYLKKDLHPESKLMIVKVFFYGIIVTVPVFFIQIWLSQLLTQVQSLEFFVDYPVVVDILKWFFVIALTEEALKYMVLKFAVLKNGELDEPLDIMLYMVIIALGFAGLENILYLLSPVNNLSFDTILKTTIIISFVRFIGATFLHTLCSALLGYFLALSFLKNKQRIPLTIFGITLATLLHGLYNFSIITLEKPMNFIIPIIIITGLGMFIIYVFDEIKKLKSICKI
mgnify:CR=1 FL=1